MAVMPNRMVILQKQKAHEHDLIQRGPNDILPTEKKKTYFLMDGRPIHYTLISVIYDYI